MAQARVLSGLGISRRRYTRPLQGIAIAALHNRSQVIRYLLLVFAWAAGRNRAGNRIRSRHERCGIPTTISINPLGMRERVTRRVQAVLFEKFHNPTSILSRSSIRPDRVGRTRAERDHKHKCNFKQRYFPDRKRSFIIT